MSDASSTPWSSLLALTSSGLTQFHQAGQDEQDWSFSRGDNLLKGFQKTGTGSILNYGSVSYKPMATLKYTVTLTNGTLTLNGQNFDIKSWKITLDVTYCKF